jgi:hypothetical protein
VIVKILDFFKNVYGLQKQKSVGLEDCSDAVSPVTPHLQAVDVARGVQIIHTCPTMLIAYENLRKWK